MKKKAKLLKKRERVYAEKCRRCDRRYAKYGGYWNYIYRNVTKYIGPEFKLKIDNQDKLDSLFGIEPTNYDSWVAGINIVAGFTE